MYTKSPQKSNFDASGFNAANPVVGAYVHVNGVIVVKRKSLIQSVNQRMVAGREAKPIVKFTAKSMSRLIATVQATGVEFGSMMTLTYPSLYPQNGKIVKADMDRFLQIMKRKYKAEYLWFLEFQKRGAPHFHVLTEHKCITPEMRKTIALTWVEGMSKANWLRQRCKAIGILNGKKDGYETEARVLASSFKFTLRRETMELLKSRDGAKRYVTKYAVKEYQKDVPEGFKGVGRFWGCSRGVSLEKVSLTKITEAQLRAFLSAQGHKAWDWKVLPEFLFGLTHL